jgi:uncharacterized membrane protein HdeD (DUF308 family)
MSNHLSDRIERRSNTWFVLGAVIMVIAGVLAISLPFATTAALSILLAWLLIAAGIGHLIAAFRFESFASFVWELLVAAAAIFAGAFMRTHPTMAPLTLTFVLAILFLASGFSELALFFRVRSAPHSGWLLLNAVVDIIIGLVVLRNWPASSLWLLGVLVGVSLLVAGISRLVFSMRVGQHLGGATPA